MISYRFATPADLPLLVETRMRVIRAVFGAAEAAALPALEKSTGAYYRAAFAQGRHCAVLALAGDVLAGCGDASFYTIMPTPPSPGGEQAYIMNMYTAPPYRRRGVASHILGMLVERCRARGITQIKLDASELGRPVYERFGFRPAGSEMVLQGPE